MGRIQIVSPAGGGGSGNVTTSGMTPNKLPIATTPTNIEDSEFYQITPASGGFTGVFVAGERIGTKKISGFGLIPTVVALAGAGVGSVATLVAGSTDMKGTINIAFGPAPVPNAIALRVTFNVPYASIPFLQLTFAGQVGGVPAARPTLYLDQASTLLGSFDLFTDAAGAALAGTVQQYNYFVVQ